MLELFSRPYLTAGAMPAQMLDGAPLPAWGPVASFGKQQKGIPRPQLSGDGSEASGRRVVRDSG